MWIMGGANPEPFRVEQDLVNFLGKEGAGWSVGYRSWIRCPPSGPTFAGGNEITFNSMAEVGVKGAANALYGVLNKLRISTIKIPASPNAPYARDFGVDSPFDLAQKNPGSVVILVGPNPMFDLSGTQPKR